MAVGVPMILCIMCTAKRHVSDAVVVEDLLCYNRARTSRETLTDFPCSERLKTRLNIVKVSMRSARVAGLLRDIEAFWEPHETPSQDDLNSQSLMIDSHSHRTVQSRLISFVHSQTAVLLSRVYTRYMSTDQF